MSRELYEKIKQLRQAYKFDPGRVLEIGSLNINGSIRDLFPDAMEYIGTDMMMGEDVDIIINAHDLGKEINLSGQYDEEGNSISKELYPLDTIICCEMLEHDDQFWITLKNIHDLLRGGGHLIISTPTFGFPIHRHPKDYYRFGEDAYREVLFEGYKIIDLQEIKHKGVNPGLVCIGKKL